MGKTSGRLCIEFCWINLLETGNLEDGESGGKDDVKIAYLLMKYIILMGGG
jgi:hypothetical protein